MLAVRFPRQVRVERVMGTVVSLDIRCELPDATTLDSAFASLQEADARFSTYRDDSELCRFDRGEVAQGTSDLRWILERCAVLRQETSGYFDVRASGRLDPSALVKGWAAQRAADILTAGGITDFCLTAGGDVVARGAASSATRGWRVGIQHPLDREAIGARVCARDLAVATSGAYERGQHIIDPRTAKAPEGVLSVTVTGPDLGTADAYSTAAFAMGLDGPRWTLGLAGYEAMTILTDVGITPIRALLAWSPRSPPPAPRARSPPSPEHRFQADARSAWPTPPTALVAGEHAARGCGANGRF